MTLQGYVNKVLAVMKTTFATANLQTSDVTALVNDARQQVAQDIYDIAPWKFGMRTGSVANPHTFATADRFVRVQVVLALGGTAPVPAALVDKEELYQMQRSAIGAGTSSKPLAYVEGQTVTVLPASPSIANIDILYVASPIDLVALTDAEETLVSGAMPYETQELIVTRTVLSCVEKLGMTKALDLVIQDYAQMLGRYKDQFVDAEESMRTRLASRNAPTLAR